MEQAPAVDADSRGVLCMPKPKRASLPFPAVLRVLLCLKLGEPLGKARSPAGIREFDITVSEGFDVLRQKVAVYAREIAHEFNNATTLNHKAPYVALATHDVPIFLKPGNNATQTEYVLLTPTNCLVEMKEAWRNAALRSTGQAAFKLELFVYAKKARPEPQPRPERVKTKRRRAHSVDGTPDDGRSASEFKRPPDNSIGGAVSAVTTSMASSSSQQERADEYRVVRVKLNGAVVEMAMNVNDLRAALGLPRSSPS
ncbi:Aste57867_727 [Aphanomyces stellatus]|uniref:Aste57867_727 protein n=1 Tax=Aphanomyces stellatus TaxID=120398 RepID=A0A485K4D1_9STRA|nr:hypothetical protein As57867_000726 [Aphanomyces stellatus]VFT77951.1 Aste57867_727 [Aphanomyces stellatus]